MGIIHKEVIFDERAPDVVAIADKITELCGLAISVEKDGPEDETDLYLMHARLAFACMPEDRIEIYSYRPGAVKMRCSIDFAEVHPRLFKNIEGLDEPDGMQVVHLKSFLGPDPALFILAVLALESFGGRSSPPLSDDERREYGRKFTVDEIIERQRKAIKRGRWMTIGMVLSAPLLVISFLIEGIWFLLTLPWRIHRACKAIGMGRGDRNSDR
ncbi:MAG: hypothetical protein ACM3ZC_01370 [Bacteroidota bacterium]